MGIKARNCELGGWVVIVVGVRLFDSKDNGRKPLVRRKVLLLAMSGQSMGADGRVAQEVAQQQQDSGPRALGEFGRPARSEVIAAGPRQRQRTDVSESERSVAGNARDQHSGDAEAQQHPGTLPVTA